MTEKIHLQWNDFQKSTTIAFRNLREDTDFADVTLACEDGRQFEAHKVVLASSSGFFQNLLSRNRDRRQPLLYMRGVASENMTAILDFLYCGEANVSQENLESFLALAQDLQINGLKEDIFGGGGNKKETPVPIKLEQRGQSRLKSVMILDTCEEVARKVNSLIERSDKMVEIGRSADGQIMYKRALICQLCGKEGSDNNIRSHIEAKHLEGIALPCNSCDKVLRTRKSLRRHKSSHVQKGAKENFEHPFNNLTWESVRQTQKPSESIIWPELTRTLV